VIIGKHNAMEVLRQQKLIITVHGRGTFVKPSAGKPHDRLDGHASPGSTTEQ